MNKQLKKVLLALLAAGCVLSAAACTETKAFTREEAEAQLDGFIVPESVTQEIGSEYAIPKVVVFDSDGGEHTPEVSAKCGDKTAEIVGGKLRLEKLQEYTLTYTLEYKGFTFEKVLRVSVTDTGKPIISVDGSTAKHRVNEEMTLPEYEVYDAGGIASETIEIYDPSDNKTSGAVDGKFMPSERGRYRMVITATDTSGNSDSAQTYFYVSGERAEFDGLENFEEGLDDGFLSGEGLSFKLEEKDGNFYASTGMDAFWPHVVFDKGAFDGYMAKGYDKLHLTLWGSNVSSHQFYYEKAKDVYTYGELKAGEKTELYIPAADLEYMLGNEGIFELIFLNEVPNEKFELCIDDIYGVFDGGYLKQEAEYSPAELLKKEIPDANLTSFKAYKDGTETAHGGAADKFKPASDGAYTLEYALEGGRGAARIVYNVVTNATDIGFEDGMSSALAFDQCTAELSDEHVTEGRKSLKLTATAAQGYPTLKFSRYFLENVFKEKEAFTFDLYFGGAKSHEAYYEYASGKYQYFTHTASSSLTVVVKREALDFLRDEDLEFLEYVILNVEGSNEEFSFWIDNLRGADVTRQAYYTHQTEACKIVAEGIKKLYLDGADITARATITATDATLPASLLTEIGRSELLVIAEGGDLVCTLEVIGEKLGFEDGNESLALSFSDVMKTNVALDFPTEGTKSLHVEVGADNGYPTLKLDRKFLENVFANTENDALCFDLRAYLAKKTHEAYFECASGKYQYFTISPDKTITVTIERAVLDFLKAGNKNTLDIVMLNAGDANESFELFFDNFRGVKAAAHTYYTGSGTPFEINVSGIKKLILNGTDVTGEAQLAAAKATLPAGLLKSAAGINELLVISDAGDWIYRLEVIGDSLSFEGGNIPSALMFDGIAKTNVAGDFPTDGVKSLHLDISVDNGYPTLKIDRRFLENVFANTEINFLCIDVTPYLVDKAHNDCYYEYAKNQYGRFDIKPNQAFTLKIKRETLEFLKAENKATLDIVIFNNGDLNEAFELFLDNFRGVKEIAETQTVYQCEGVTFAVNGAKSVSLGGKNVTANATIGDKQATLSAAALKGLSGKQEVIIRTAEGNYLYTVNVIGDKLSFEDGEIGPVISFADVTQTNVAGDFPTDGVKSLRMKVGTNNGYPNLKIDARFLENVFADAEVNFLCIDGRPYLAKNAHGGYYEYASGQYDRFTINPDQSFTLKIKRETLEFLKANNKETLDIVILNEAGGSNEEFELFLDNFRGEKA